ncbi:MAG: class I SAM-dependent methyltransferase, partial [Gammaproteobacteria bacterium]|nr:class I SAM-dependent methyltransferase [Gammaproteobacteria bacterium]
MQHGSEASRAFRSIPTHVHIGILTFAILCLELTLIRWTGGQMRAFAYFANIVLIGAFLGLGLGCGLGRKGKDLLGWTFPLLLLLSVPLALAESLNITNLHFPDRSVALWGGEGINASPAEVVRNLAIFLGVWALIVAVFFCLGTRLGRLFRDAGPKKSLKAYSWDLGGSIAGVVAFAVLTVSSSPPAAWFLFSLVPLLWIGFSRTALLCFPLILALAYHSHGEAIYSPYNRIDVIHQDEGSIHYKLRVNRDFHQVIHDLRTESVEQLSGKQRSEADFFKRVYDLPFALLEGGESALIVGAGTGNDAAAALRNGYSDVTAVDIDPLILDLGSELHPEQPYQNGAKPVVRDARAYFATAEPESFDLVSFGLLDSHAMVASMSSLRIDNFVYTRQSIEQAWALVKPGGALVISFSVFSGEWIANRLRWTIFEATGQDPVTIFHGMHYGLTFFVNKGATQINSAAVGEFESLALSYPQQAVRISDDDWPFLYTRPGVFPWLYLGVLALVVLTSVVGTRIFYREENEKSAWDPAMFFLGAGFLLLETRGITAMSVLAGSTWIVNAAVFLGVLSMALLATLLVRVYSGFNSKLLFGLLIASCIGLYFFELGALNQFDVLT